MAKITKQDLVEKLSAYTSTKKEAGEYLNVLLGIIKEELGEGNTVTITGFGTFSITKRAARMGRNPATGGSIKIPARNAVRFKVGKDLKDSVN